MPAQSTPESKPVYVYGVVPAGVAGLRAKGVADRPLEVVEDDGLAAVVSDFPSQDQRLRRRDLHAHLRSLEQIFGVTTVAPCAFGTVMASRADVSRGLLAARRDELRDLLERLEGHAQINVKVEYDDEAVLRDVVADDPEIGRARERARAVGDAGYYENIRLGERVAASIAVRRTSDAEEIMLRLGAVAVDAVAEPPASELGVFKGSFLVPTDRLEQFDSALEALADAGKGRLRFESFGPLPPTAFATLRAEG